MNFIRWIVDDVSRYRRHPHYVLLIVQGVGIILKPDERIHLMVEVTLGHKIPFSIVYLDANGNPMLTQPTPDSPPTWTDTTPATETLAVSADGTTCLATTIAAGNDVVNLSVVVGGKTFAATTNVTVDPLPQVLTSVAIGVGPIQ